MKSGRDLDANGNTFTKTRSEGLSVAIGLLQVCQASLPMLHMPVVVTIVNWTVEALKVLETIETNIEDAGHWLDLFKELQKYVKDAECPPFSKLIEEFSSQLGTISTCLEKIRGRRGLKKLIQFPSDRRRMITLKRQYDGAKDVFLIRVIMETMKFTKLQTDFLSARMTDLESRVLPSRPTHCTESLEAMKTP